MCAVVNRTHVDFSDPNTEHLQVQQGRSTDEVRAV